MPMSEYRPYIGCKGMIGLCCMGCVLSESSIPKGTAYIDHICVDSSFRGKGVGTVLLERADYEARLRGCYVSLITYILACLRNTFII